MATSALRVIYLKLVEKIAYRLAEHFVCRGSLVLLLLSTTDAPGDGARHGARHDDDLSRRSGERLRDGMPEAAQYFAFLISPSRSNRHHYCAIATVCIRRQSTHDSSSAIVLLCSDGLDDSFLCFSDFGNLY